ncbi:hypothetical protein ABTE11_23620, partial [Acinetobacter baumannii]
RAKGRGIAEFADGSVSLVDWSVAAGGELVAAVGAYRTARGTDIAATRWRLKPADGVATWKVAGRLLDL